jgi:hypothetical protein
MSICIIEEVLDIIMPDAIIAIFLQSTQAQAQSTRRHLLLLLQEPKTTKMTKTAQTSPIPLLLQEPKTTKMTKNCPNFPHSGT